MLGPEFVVNIPPLSLVSLAALLAAATTDGSSVAMGIKYSFPFIRKFAAIPNGI
jgi:hypothetical protein